MFFIAITLTLLASAPTEAARLPLARVFEQAKPGQPICFGREYASSHLEKRPAQTVRKIQAKLVRDRTAPGFPNDYVELELSLKGEENFFRVHRTYLACDLRSGLCTMDCDGGRVEAWGEGQKLLLRNEGLLLEGGCGEENPRWLRPSPGGDDSFLLSRLPAEFCQL